MEHFNRKAITLVVSVVYLLLSNCFPLRSQEVLSVRPESCTSIMVGREATTDGSVITSHTCDAWYRTWIDIVPASDHKEGEKHKVYKGTLHTSTAWSREGVELAGEIPEVSHTYAYLNTAYPSMNEKQLAIGESTFGGKRVLHNDNGMFLIEELQRIALQRCTTAREAIRLIGELIERYGYADWGECITLADKQEVWHMEIVGPGPGKPGGVWAAQRIPDDHVGIAANISRIGTIDLSDPDHYMVSKNVFKVAKKLGLWDGKEPFRFWKAYGNSRKPFSIREFYVLSTMAPSLHLSMDADELPFSVHPDKKVDVRQVLAFFRATYDSTEWEMIRNLKVPVRRKDAEGNEVVDTVISPAAHPWLARDKRALLNALKPGVVKRDRPISVQYCAYSWVAQLRADLPDEVGGRLWFSLDIPRLSARFPIYAGNLSVPESFRIGGEDHFSRNSALWAFRRANRLALVKWGEGRKVIEPVVLDYEEKAFDEVPYIEKRALELLQTDRENAARGDTTLLARKYLTRYSNAFARTVTQHWWELGDRLWVKFRWSF